MAELVGNYPLWGDVYEQQRQIESLIEASNETDDLVGTMLRFSVADGYAWYRVTNVEPLEVEFVPFADEYAVHPALIRGLNEDDVREQKEYAKRIRANIGRKR